jgi:DNA-binding IclR family transcriptional regulator
VNLEPIARTIGQLIEQLEPLEGYAPETVAQLRKARDHLPEIMSGVEAMAVEELQKEARAIAQGVFGSLGNFLDAALRASKRRDRAAAKPKKKRGPPARMKGKKR